MGGSGFLSRTSDESEGSKHGDESEGSSASKELRTLNGLPKQLSSTETVCLSKERPTAVCGSGEFEENEMPVIEVNMLEGRRVGAKIRELKSTGAQEVRRFILAARKHDLTGIAGYVDGKVLDKL